MQYLVESRARHIARHAFPALAFRRTETGALHTRPCFDVAIDLRRDSPAFCRWIGIELCWRRRSALFIPLGCAHGFLTLDDDCEIFYMMGAVYRPEAAAGFRWNDPAVAVGWPFAPIVSKRCLMAVAIGG
jgi:dTDP-4-dehydrorhamnose 3,5-epimerase